MDLEDVGTTLKNSHGSDPLACCQKAKQTHWLLLVCLVHSVKVPYLQVRQTELYLPVQTPRSHESGVQGVRPVGGHEDLDVPPGVKAVQLVDELQHGPLDLVVSPGAVIKAGA